MKVTNLTSPRTNAKVAQQYNVEMNGVDYFQSYDTVVARHKPYNLEVTPDWKYSKTTSKYFSQWLEQWGYTSSEVDRLKKLLSASSVGDEFTLELDNGNKTWVYIAQKGDFEL